MSGNDERGSTDLPSSARPAVTALFHLHYRRLVGLAGLLVDDRETAEEVVQDAFVKAYRALWRFRPGAPFKPWLLRIVANEARNRVRSTGRRHALELRLAEGYRPGGAAPSPEAAAVAAEDRRRLLSMVNALSEEDRMVIASRYFLELSGEETAEALGIPEGTVKSRLSRALARLRERVGEVSRA